MDNYKKPYTFHFYLLVPADAGSALRTLFENHIKSGTNIPHAISSDYNHHIQIQYLKPHETSFGSLVSGVMTKYSKSDLPTIGEIGKSNERPIMMTSDEALIEKTYFLYNSSRHVLLYQTNIRGTSCKQFSKYLASARLGNASFEPLLTHQSYNMLKKGHPIKKFTVSFAPPTNPKILQDGNSDDWSDIALSLLNSAQGAKITISTTADLSDKKNNSPASIPTDIVLSFMKKLTSNKEAFSDVRGKAELISEQDISHSIDLVANRVSASVDILMEGRYPEEGAILAKMMKIMEDKDEEICAITGYGEK